MPHSRMRFTATLATLVALVAAILVPQSAQALTLDGHDFDPGSIVTDAQFFNGNSMTVAEIQSFLSAKVKSCGSGGRCLSVLTEDTVTRQATSIHDDGVNPLCSEYTGAIGETAAQIIYNVQQACHISAKVILVTLQKEQGLITNSNPTADKIKIAMGYACPDTAPCAKKYFGFYNQVYSAASQFKRYTDPASTFYASKPVGRTSAILYNPDATCGTKNVRIANAATHALYLYTPYTPNGAALANLTGSGDKCSSYGNSNFWEYYNYWFNARANLDSDIDAMDAAVTDAWGNLVDESTCTETANTCVAVYDRAVAQWNINSHTLVSNGLIATLYRATGTILGRLGAILKPEETVNGGNHGDGSRQKFANGFIYLDPDNVANVVLNDVQTYYDAAGGPAGSLGWPDGNARCDDTGACSQNFAGGYVMTDPSSSFHVLSGAIADYLQANGGIHSPWGLPLGDAESIAIGGGTGRSQLFENGTAYERDGTAILVPNSMAKAVIATGGPATLGMPLSGVESDGSITSQVFAAGRVVATGSTGFLIPTDSFRAFRQADGLTGYLGLPASAATNYKGKDGFVGSKQLFTGGVIIRGSKGTFAIPNAIWGPYRGAKGAMGKKGWPTAKAVESTTTWSQDFQKGTITVSK